MEGLERVMVINGIDCGEEFYCDNADGMFRFIDYQTGHQTKQRIKLERFALNCQPCWVRDDETAKKFENIGTLENLVIDFDKSDSRWLERSVNACTGFWYVDPQGEVEYVGTFNRKNILHLELYLSGNFYRLRDLAKVNSKKWAKYYESVRY